MNNLTILTGDCLDQLRTLPENSVHCVVTSPPYWGLRDYGVTGQLGLEKTPEEYIAKMVAVFQEVKRVLREDGTLWLNMGDSYAGSWGDSGHRPERDGVAGTQREKKSEFFNRNGHPQDNKPVTVDPPGLKPKDLCGIPWRVALALQADGWWLRQDIIWEKGNPMPESVTDRNTKSHEYIFLLTKSARYWYDSIAIQERCGNEAVQYVQETSPDAELLQEQSAAGRTVWPVCRMHKDGPEEIRSQIQQITKGESKLEALLLFQQRTEGQEKVSDGIHVVPGTTGTISAGITAAPKGTEIQGTETAVRSNHEGQGNEGPERCPIFQNSKRNNGKKTDGVEAQILSCQHAMHIDVDGMAGHHERTRISLCLLPQTKTPGNGSCDTIVEGRDAYKGKHSPRLQNMQREKREPHYRNARSVWHINTQPYPEAHFATFPEALPERCIKAGTSEKGCCPKCGKPWERVVEKSRTFESGSGKSGNPPAGKNGPGLQGGGETGDIRRGPVVHATTIGWSPACDCGLDPAPCVVLDPFGGSGTTAYVARNLGRAAILIELNPKYIELIKRRNHESMLL
jgi:DNA modification methylase